MSLNTNMSIVNNSNSNVDIDTTANERNDVCDAPTDY